MRPGAFAIGVENAKTPANIGTLWRSAFNLGAALIFTIGYRPQRQVSDTLKASHHIPLVHFQDVAHWRAAIPEGWMPIGVEITEEALPLPEFRHPMNACYVLGPEDGSLSREIRQHLPRVVSIPSRYCLNVAVAGSIVMYDRVVKARYPGAPPALRLP